MNMQYACPRGVCAGTSCAALASFPDIARWRRLAGTAVGTLAAISALANGGPFVVKYPGGDPAAKGILARLDSGLQPTRESRLQVLKENLSLRYDTVPSHFPAGGRESLPPLVTVTAEYFITNATTDQVEVDFGFPILRGIYIPLYSMMPTPDVHVRVDGTNHSRPKIISNSAIYGILRSQGAGIIEQALLADRQLLDLFRAVQAADEETRESAHRALADYLKKRKSWTEGDTELLVQYAVLNSERGTSSTESGTANKPVRFPVGAGSTWWQPDLSLVEAQSQLAWAVLAIGERKATQWLTHLASRFDPAQARSYEAIFEAWGGNVQERSVDLATRRVRPREISLQEPRTNGLHHHVLAASDPTVYARVDYLNENAGFSEAEKESWKAVLKNLPVVFTFAPMNLLHYRVAFEPGTTRTVTVSYRQYAYLDTDTKSPRSYQMAYVVHPASLWDSFGPIHLTVTTPEGVTPVASVRLSETDTVDGTATGFVHHMPGPASGAATLELQSHAATVTKKTGELFVGISADEWEKVFPKPVTASVDGKERASR